MVVPPGVPITKKGFPFCNTKVGVIELSMRLPGAIALASPCTSPNWFGVPGRAEEFDQAFQAFFEEVNAGTADQARYEIEYLLTVGTRQ